MNDMPPTMSHAVVDLFTPERVFIVLVCSALAVLLHPNVGLVEPIAALALWAVIGLTIIATSVELIAMRVRTSERIRRFTDVLVGCVAYLATSEIVSLITSHGAAP